VSRGAARAVAVALALAAGACSYRGAPEPGLCLDRQISTRPFEGSRVTAAGAAGLAYVPGDDHLWLGDGEADQLYVFERRTGAYRARLPARRFVEAFPEAGRCGEGAGEGGGAGPGCSYTDQLETVLYDPDTATLYVINAVDDADPRGPEDRPALFTLRRREGGEGFRFWEWRKLPEGSTYRTGTVIEGRIYVAVGDALVEYELESNRLAREPVLRSPAGPIAGVAWDGSHVWLVEAAGALVQLEWPTAEPVASHDLASLGVRRPAGLALGPGEILVPEGRSPHPIHVLGLEDAPTGLVRAGWAGGWPRSCP